MGDLKADQLDAIRRLLIEPLRDAVRQEIRLSHERLAGTVGRLGERVEGRLADHERRIEVVERSTARLRAFRRRVMAVYGLVTVMIGIAWSIVREKLLGRWIGRE